MSDSGNTYGKHLHFEVYKGNQRINPQEYLNKDLPKLTKLVENKYQVGDIVEINGVYISSTSQHRSKPLITKGKITKIIDNASNPYLLENGNIVWVNNNTIISKENNRYLSNKNYKGTSIIDDLKEINIDSSYNYRSKLAKINDINNYQGTTEQNKILKNTKSSSKKN